MKLLLRTQHCARQFVRPIRDFNFNSLNFSLIVHLSIYVPVLIALFRIRKLEKFYAYFFLYLLLGGLNESMYYIINTEKSLRIQVQYIWYIVGTSIIVKMIFESYLIKPRWIWVFLFSIILYSGDYYFQFGESIKTPFVYTISKFIISIFIIFLISIELVSVSKSHKIPKLLIYIPLLLTNLIFVFLQLFYFFYFSMSSKDFLNSSYHFFRIFLIISYIMYSIAFLWAPKKEVYL